MFSIYIGVNLDSILIFTYFLLSSLMGWGVTILRCRQSSSVGGASRGCGKNIRSNIGLDIHLFLYLVASRGSVHASADCGGAKRRSPTGGTAYGMLLNTWTVVPSYVWTSPMTGPWVVSTGGVRLPSTTPTATNTSKTATDNMATDHRYGSNCTCQLCSALAMVWTDFKAVCLQGLVQAHGINIATVIM